MPEKIIQQGTVYCSVIKEHVEVIVTEGFFGTTKKLLCPYLYGHWNDCAKRKDEDPNWGVSCGIYKSL
jgi:hypothetical protein